MLKLKELTIENIQGTKKLTIKLVPYFNVIIGDTGAGKTTLIRSLALLFTNQPRNAEAIFKNKHTLDKSKKIKIKAIDTNNNIIKRNNKIYYLNDKKLQAVGTKVPEPIMELFPFQSINWQRQLESHFLILETGGNSAKILNAFTGLEDQELLLSEYKIKLSEHNSEIKRLLKNNEENNKIIKKLKNINNLYNCIKHIKELKKQLKLNTEAIDKITYIINKIIKNKIDPLFLKKLILIKNKILNIELIKIENDRKYIMINRLDHLINEIKNNKVKSSYIKKLNKISETIKSILELKNYLDSINQKIKNIDDIITNLNNVNYSSKKYITYNMLIHSINSILNEFNKQNEILNKKEKLSYLINKIINERSKYSNLKYELEQIENKFYKKLLEVGQCPYCGTIIKKGKISHECSININSK